MDICYNKIQTGTNKQTGTPTECRNRRAWRSMQRDSKTKPSKTPLNMTAVTQETAEEEAPLDVFQFVLIERSEDSNEESLTEQSAVLANGQLQSTALLTDIKWKEK